MDVPLISILLPAHNAGATLQRTLDSIRRQTEQRWECVIVDDGSTDNTRECAELYQHADNRFRILATPQRGIVHALNTGLGECRGEFVARMDADDIMLKSRLARQFALLEGAPQLSAVGCHVRLVPRSKLLPKRIAYESWLNAIATPEDVVREAFIECPIAHPTLFCRTNVLREFGYRDLGWPEDYDLVLRLLAQGHALGNVARPLLLWRDSPTRLSRTHPAYSLSSFVECKAHFLAQGFLSGTDAYILWGYGETGQTLSRALERHGKGPSYIVELHPGRIGQRIRGAPVIKPEELTQVFRRPLVVSVAGLTARSEIRAKLAEFAFREGRDFVCAA